MLSTTGPAGSSRARVIYHTPVKSFAWLHKDGSFADLQKALRARLNISKNEPLVIKQVDGDYTLDIETEEEYEAFCHFAKSVSQLHVSVNGGLMDQSKRATEVAATFSIPSVPVVLPPDPVPQPPTESEDPTLGKRKASEITTDPGATPSVTQKRKKRRKVGLDQSTPAADISTVEVAPPEPTGERGVVPGDATYDAAGPSVVGGTNQGTTSQTQKKKRKKKAVGQSDPTPMAPVDQHVEPPTESPSAPEPPPTKLLGTRKRKTVVLDLSTVIQPPVAAQDSQSTSTAQQPSPIIEPSPSTKKEVPKKTPAKRKAKALVESSKSTPVIPVPHPNGVDEPVSSSTKPKPPVSKSRLPEHRAYVQIITKKRKTGQTDGSSTVEKETKQQGPVKKPAQPTAGKPKGNPRKSKKADPTEGTPLHNGPNIHEIMDGVIAAAMEDAKKRASTSGTTTDVSENFTPPPQNKSESTARKPKLADTSSLEPTSSTTLLDAIVPAMKTVDSDSVTAPKKARVRKSHPGVLPSLKDSDSAPLASNAHHSLHDDPPVLPPSLKIGYRLSDLPRSRSERPATISPVSATRARLSAPPPSQKAVNKSSPAETQPEESASEEDEDSATPKKKPAPVSDPDDELDAFLHAPTHPSQRSVLEDLPSDSEDDEEEVEREDMEMDEEDEGPKSKWSGHGQLKVMGRTRSSSDDDSDPESVVSDVLVKADQAKVNTQVTHVSETSDIVPSSDLEDEGGPLLQPTKSADTSTNVVAPASSTPDSPGPHMTPISNLKSAGQALSFFNEHVLDNPDPIENTSSLGMPPNDLPEDAEDPIENADTASTPKPDLVQRMKGRNKTPGPATARKNGAGLKATQSSLTSSPKSMLPPPTPSRGAKGDFTFSQPLDQSTPAAIGVSRKKQPISQTTVPETPSHSAWTTLPRREPSTQSTDDPVMVDELVSSPTETAARLLKATPPKKPVSSQSTKQTPLFLPSTSQYQIPSSDLPAAEESPSDEAEEDDEDEDEEDEDEEKVIVPPSSRVLRSRTTNSRKTTPYRSLSVLASQRSIFPSTPIEPAAPTPANKSRAKPESDDDDDDDDEEDSGVSDSDSDSPPASHIPKGRRAGVGSGNRGKMKGQLKMWS